MFFSSREEHNCLYPKGPVVAGPVEDAGWGPMQGGEVVRWHQGWAGVVGGWWPCAESEEVALSFLRRRRDVSVS